MAFHYGSDSPEIKNPFKKEGGLYLLSGFIIILIGIISILSIRGQIVEEGTVAGWLNLSASLAILLLGGHFVSKGLIRVSRFYVGRGAPTSLSKNRSRSEKHFEEPSTFYKAKDLEQMLVGRKNLTFQEPVTMFDRIIYSLFPKFMFLPISMRNYLHIIVKNVSFSLTALLIYAIAILSGSIGLTLLTSSSFNEWLGIILSLFILGLWIKNPVSTRNINYKDLHTGSNSKIILFGVAAILVPVIAEIGLRNGMDIPAAPFNPTFFLVLSYIAMGLIFVAGILLAYYRSENLYPITEVSESREHWQENVHPKDFFRALDMEMAELRYKEIPNRVYRELNPNLNMEGSMDKGSFEGDTIQETQPIYEPIQYSSMLPTFRLAFSVIGHVFVIIASLILYRANSSVSNSFDFATVFELFSYPLILFLIGSGLLAISHLFWGEMQFKSFLIQFHGEGTYTESKLSVGMSVTDSVRSENTVVRTSYSSWFIASEVISTIQAKPGTNTLSRARYIMSIDKADSLMNHLLNQVKSFLGDREMIAVADSTNDEIAMNAISDKNSSNIFFEKLPKEEEEKVLAAGQQRELNEEN